MNTGTELIQELRALFKNDRSFTTTTPTGQDWAKIKQLTKINKPERVLSYKLDKGLFSKNSYVYTPTGVYINEYFCSIIGVEDIKMKKPSVYSFCYVDTTSDFNINSETANYLKRMIKIINEYLQTGDNYAYGIGVPKDLEKALYYYNQTLYFDYYLDPSVILTVASADYYRKKYYRFYAYNLFVSSYNVADAYYNLGLLFHYGLDFKEDKNRALEYYSKALEIENDHSNACCQKAHLHYKYKEYDECFKTLIQINDESIDPNLLGICYSNGYGCEQDIFKANKLYLEGGKKNIGLCYYNLAINELYRGFSYYYVKYLNNYEKITKATPHFLWGCGYHYGFGVGKDDDKAIEHFLQIINKNPKHNVSYYYLGKIHYERKDYKKAYEYFMHCYNNDNAVGNYHLYLMYSNGYYVTKDLDKALQFLFEGVQKQDIKCMTTVGCSLCNEAEYYDEHDEGMELLRNAVDLETGKVINETSYNLAIKNYIQYIYENPAIETLEDLKKEVEYVFRVSENKAWIEKEFASLEQYYVDKILSRLPEEYKIKKDLNLRRNSTFPALHIYSGNRFHCFLSLQTRKVYKLLHESVENDPKELEPYTKYTITWGITDPLSARKRRTSDVLFEDYY